MLSPDKPYDREGVFTGCLVPHGPAGEKGVLTTVYSSITALPIHWTLPHTRNCAGLSLATSVDGGATWTKRDDVNPVLEGEPEGVTVTGFRDPVVTAWPAMDDALGERGPGRALYGVVSGGIVDEGPNAFVYRLEPDDLTRWKYLGPLVDVPMDYQRPSHWTGDFGVNWECVNFMTLRDECRAGRETQMLTMGTEGGLKKHPEDGGDPHGQWSMWMGGSLQSKTDGAVRLEPEFSGVFDHGCFYAANSYEHPVTGRRIVWGWIKEDELTLARREAKGWTGYLSLQREVFLYSASNVVGTIGSRLEDIPSFKVEGDGSRRKTVQTMGIRPLQELQTLRQRKPITWSSIPSAQVSGHLINASSTSWELEATVRVDPRLHRRLGLDILHNGDKSRRTRIYFSPSAEEIVVDRSRSNNKSDIQKDAVSGAFTLLVSENDDGREGIETLQLRVFSDGDVLEIFANDRFALSTVVYADSNTCNGVSWFVETEGEAGADAAFESLSIWEGLANVQK